MLVERDIVGNIDCGRRVSLSSILHHAATESVQLVESHITLTSQSLQYLLLCLSVGTIGKHAHEVGETQRRDDLGVETSHLREEIECKLIVLLDECLLSIRKNEIFRIHILRVTFRSFQTGGAFMHLVLCFLACTARCGQRHCHSCESHCCHFLVHHYNLLFVVFT